MDAQVNRVERRRTQTRQALITAGHRLFAARAIEGVSIDDIVDAADVAKGSFYNYFDDKHQLAAAIIDEVQRDCEVQITAANQGITDPAHRIVRAVCVVIRLADAHPDQLQALISLAQRRTVADTPLNKGMAADIRNGIAQGRVRGIDLEGAILLVMGIVNITALHLCVREANASKEALAATMGAAILRGLGLSNRTAQTLATDAATDLLGSVAAQSR